MQSHPRVFSLFIFAGMLVPLAWTLAETITDPATGTAYKDGGTPVSVVATCYAPGGGGIQGGNATSKARWNEPKLIPCTLDDVRLKQDKECTYVTLACNQANYQKAFVIGNFKYVSALDGKEYVITDLVGYCHDTGDAFMLGEDKCGRWGTCSVVYKKYDIAYGRGTYATSLVYKNPQCTGLQTWKQITGFVGTPPPPTSYATGNQYNMPPPTNSNAGRTDPYRTSPSIASYGSPTSGGYSAPAGSTGATGYPTQTGYGSTGYTTGSVGTTQTTGLAQPTLVSSTVGSATKDCTTNSTSEECKKTTAQTTIKSFLSEASSATNASESNTSQEVGKAVSVTLNDTSNTDVGSFEDRNGNQNSGDLTGTAQDPRLADARALSPGSDTFTSTDLSSSGSNMSGTPAPTTTYQAILSAIKTILYKILDILAQIGRVTTTSLQ